MKKIMTVLLAAVMVFAFSVTVFAAEGDSPVADVIIKATDANGNDATPYLKVVTNSVSEEAKTELGVAKLKEILGDKYKANLAVSAVYDVIYTGTAYPVTITFKAESVKAGKIAYVLHKGASGWEIKEGTAGDKQITVTFDSLSPVAIVTEKTAPGTGTNAAVAAVVAIVALAGAAYATKRSFNA